MSVVLHPRDQWEWYGCPGHLIVSQDCRFHLCTIVGPWLVSTVGEWLPDPATWDIYARSAGVTLEGKGDARRAQFLREVGYVDIGAGRKYETMVFRTSSERCVAPDCGCGMPLVSDWSEIDSDSYNVRGEAQSGHQTMCERWASKPEGSPARWDEETGAA